MAETFKTIERKGWNERAGVYASTTALATTQAVASLLRAVRPRPGLRLLDICTGPGFAAGAAAAIGCEVTGIDFAPEMVAEATARFPQCAFALGDAEALEQPDAAFDAAICNFGVFHFTEPETAFAEAFRVLQPGGRYAWSQWLGPDKSELFAVFFNAIKTHADMDIGLPPAPPAFRLSDADAARSAMQETGFEEIDIDPVPIVLHAPTGDMLDFFRTFGVRTAMVMDRQVPEAVEAIKHEVNEGLARYFSDDGVIVPMPAMVISGRKPG